jgi:hypothetical protein
MEEFLSKLTLPQIYRGILKGLKGYPSKNKFLIKGAAMKGNN